MRWYKTSSSGLTRKDVAEMVVDKFVKTVAGGHGLDMQRTKRLKLLWDGEAQGLIDEWERQEDDAKRETVEKLVDDIGSMAGLKTPYKLVGTPPSQYHQRRPRDEDPWWAEHGYREHEDYDHQRLPGPVLGDGPRS